MSWQLRLGRDKPPPPIDLPCVERLTPNGKSTWVHAWSGRDFDSWTRFAGMAKGHLPEPSKAQLAVCQVIWVCRTGPDGERTFLVNPTEATDGLAALHEWLPPRWVEAVCNESDALSLRSYFPPPDTQRQREGEAGERLTELLADRKLWAHLDWVARRLNLGGLAARGEPIGDVLTILQHDEWVRSRLIQALGALGAAAGGL